MLKKISLTTIASLVIIFSFFMIKNKNYIDKSNKISAKSMPLVNDPFALETQFAPIEQRGEEFKKWLSKGVRVEVSGGSGSGTIIYFDRKEGWAYVQSCGHLWNGNMSAKEAQKRNIQCKVTTWYMNDLKLDSPKTYKAEVLFYSNHASPDISLLRFKADWDAKYFPIAPIEYEVKPDERAHSIGCDGAREIAHYDVKIVGYRDGSWKNLITVENSPRPGRSGGGLISDDGYYIGICWGTSSYSGNGQGYFTPLSDIRRVMIREGYEWLLQISQSLAKQIPIVDRNNPQGIYDKDYIAIPTP